MIQLLPGIRIKEPFRHSTYGRVKVKTIQLFLGKHKTSPKVSFSQFIHKTSKLTAYLIVNIFNTYI